MTDLTLWAYTNQEISDLKIEFENIFNTELVRDYENIWEWIWNGQTSDNRINISREHNMKSGEYDKPLRIILNWNSGHLDKTHIVKEIQSILKTKIFIGEIKNSGRAKDDYIAKEIIKYEL